MPVVRSRVAPAPAPATKSTDEALELELSLQRKFEEDVARIFDESIYTDFELVCGRSKILTHKCILKARTKRFYQKLETVLNVNINQNTYDEIYSFISDAYTECNIKKQEKEILEFLDKTFGYLSQNSSAEKNIIKESATAFPSYAKADIDEAEVFLSPKSPECTTPYYDKEKRKSISSSPSIELTKEYYALVPIDNRLLEQELREQDVLLNAFQSIIKSQSEESSKDTSLQRNKPTSLSLRSSLSSKSSLHSSDCDPLLKKTDTNQACSEADTKSEQSPNTSKAAKAAFIKSTKDPVTKSVDVAFSPDSLIADEPSFVTDEPSSSSDYLSAAYNFSPCISTSGYNPQLNVGKQITKMDNVFTSSDSGLENTGLLESLNGQKDVTLTDISLTDSTLHDLITDDASHSSSPQQDNFQVQRTKYDNSSQATSLSGTSSDNYYEPPHRKQTYKTSKESTSFKSSKEEKQRQNEEIVILESSSLSSETGSWESVFPPKLGEKEACTAFLINERQVSNMADKSDQIHRNKPSNHYKEDLCPSLVQKSPFKSTSCFIDAASLVDDEEATITVHTDVNQERVHIRAGALPVPSQPVPCSTAKPDISPGDWSEGHDNDDSLEQLDQKDPDSLQKDLSPTIFDMTPITEDSLCANFENATHLEDETMSTEKFTAADNEPPNSTVRSHVLHASTASFAISTPHNSIMSLRSSTLKQDHSEDDSDSTIVTQDEPSNVRKQKNLDYSPIVSGGASIEDHLPQVNSYTSSPMARRKIENIPIVSGAYVPEKEEKKKSVPKTSKPSAVAAWVVDMSNSGKSDDSSHSSDSKKPNDRNFESLKHECSQDTNCKSRSSVDSNGSEKSSHKFYIDLSSLPDPLPPKNESTSKSVTEKKNIFSMYIDLGEKSSLKEMPARLSSSLSGKKNLDSSKSSSSSITDTNTKSIGNSKLANISETTNKSKESSTPKVVKSNNVTFETPKGMASFEEYEALCEIPDISITDIIGVWPVSEKSKTSSSDVKTKKDLQSVQEEIEIKGNQENIKPKSEQTNEVFKGSDVKTMDVFVRLSDLDKPKPHVDSMIAIHEHSVTDVRMTRSIPDYDQKHAGGRSIDVISSFHSENALSLNRLFPHLKNEFSRSMPGSLSRTRSPIITTASSLCELEEQPSDLSEVSSVQSSYCRSVVENSTTEESQTSSLIGHCQSKLGQDLLRMFLEEIAPDVIVEVSGRRFKAHKCILSSRCQYFAGILSGGWVESAGNVIILPPFSFNVVHFALCHIYSGVSTIPDSISIVELATIADMLGLEGLKEAIMFTLKVKYCHHFHKPCLVCTAGVLECFTLSSVYGLDDLYLKCLKWISKYFHIVWPTKAFATLPKELLDKCYQQHIVNMTVDNLPDTVCGCGMIVGILQSTRWAETVERMCRRLLNAGARFAAPRLLGVLRAVAALPVEEVPPLGLQALDDCLSVAIEWAPPDEACRAYAFLSHVVKEIRSRHSSKPDLVSNGDVVSNNLLWFHANDWRLRCESSIVRSAPRAIDTQAFQDLPQDLRKRLRELGCIIYGTRTMSTSNQERKQKVTPPRSKPHTSTRSLDMEHVRALFVPYAAAPNARQGSAARPQRPPPKPLPIRSTRAQEQRAKFNLLNTNQSQDRGKRAPRPDRFENTKPRYLEPRPTQDKKRLTVKMVSSSESSRNSSPVQPRAARASRICAQHDSASAAMSQDSLASRPRTAEPSTDSLTESQTSNKYATYTKAKHPKGSVESIKSCTRPALTVATAAKMKTKIPVLLNHHPKRVANGKGPANGPAAPPSQGGPCDRKVSGSLMMATKSSQAKMVPKINKDEKPAGKTVTKPKGKAKNVSKVKQAEIAPPVDIPAMSRSGTFLKDEPMFGGNTTDIDIAP